ncbi:MAG: GNAT family N-acetyltransferase, partial [Acidobacteria bacterium]|nr:GNAT family N-acetyltransferase [Acidobacteriota bacterium]
MTPDYRIEPTTDAHVAGLQAAIDAVARERRYLAVVRGFPLEATRQFVASVTAGGGVQHVALDGADVIGWCDI